MKKIYMRYIINIYVKNNYSELRNIWKLKIILKLIKLLAGN